MFTSYGHIIKLNKNHRCLDDFRPGHVPALQGGEYTFRLLVYALMYFRAKCLLKVIFLFIPIWNIVVMRKKRDCIFF